ncbi:hypothetical protein WN943_022460 [Citrus x changshan-huyou]
MKDKIACYMQIDTSIGEKKALLLEILFKTLCQYNCSSSCRSSFPLITILPPIALLGSSGSFFSFRHLVTSISFSCEKIRDPRRCFLNFLAFLGIKNLSSASKFCFSIIFETYFSKTDYFFHITAILHINILEVWSKNKPYQFFQT